MGTLTKVILEVEPVAVRVNKQTLSVDLADGRTIAVPTQWFPRLAHGTPQEWANYELSYDGIHWPDLNEDIPVEGLLVGEKSAESPKSIKRWLSYRARGEKEPIPELPLPPEIAHDLAKAGIWNPKDNSRGVKGKSKPHDRQRKAG
jgi:hypothetical protein